MKLPYKAVKVTEKVYWVGAIDWGMRDFHGYSTNRGTTYNAYLVVGDEPALIDTVKAPFLDEMMARVSSVIDPSRIKTIVSNHAEMDHSGCLPPLIEQLRPQKIYCSVMGAKALQAHFHHNWTVTPVKDGETVSLCGDRLTFYESRMLHWPDSMVGYLAGEKLLFSNDIFGMHLASDKRFDDETHGWFYEAAKYYSNIVMPYSDIALAFLKKFKGLGLPLSVIAPDHGPIWRRDYARIIELYEQWATRRPRNKAVIVFDTMWGATEMLANGIAEGLISGGTEAKVMPLKAHHRSDVITELLDSGALLVGSPTMNKQLFPSVADMLTYARGLNPKKLVGNSFGSYGWSPDGPSLAGAALEQMKVELVGQQARCQFVPDSAALEGAFRLGQDVSARLREITA